MSQIATVDQIIELYVANEFDDSMSLANAGLTSLSIFRILAELQPDPEMEIDIEGLAAVSTIADLKAWLGGMIDNLDAGADR